MYFVLYPSVSSNTYQEQLSLSSLVLHRNKALWESREQPVHPDTASNITPFKWENTLLQQKLPQGTTTATSQKVAPLVSFNPDHLNQTALLVLAVFHGSPAPPATLKPAQEDREGLTQVNSEQRAGCRNSFPQALCGGIQCGDTRACFGEDAVHRLTPRRTRTELRPPPTHHPAPCRHQASSNSGLKGWCITERVLTKLKSVARLR